MKNYETIIILNPNLENNIIEEAISNVEKNIKKNNGEVLKIERWGKKKLAYEVKKFNYGFYVLFNIKADLKAVNELENSYRLSENVIKHIIVKTDEEKAGEQKKE
ncbi:MAG: 30S ribosomal protein S6 [bacterium]